MGQFKKFAKDCGIIGKSLSTDGVDRVFLRANQDRSDGLADMFVDAKMQKKQDKWKEERAKAAGQGSGAAAKPMIDNDMYVEEFAAGLVRLAHARFRAVSGIGARLSKLLEEHVKTHPLFAEMAAGDHISASLAQVLNAFNFNMELLQPECLSSSLAPRGEFDVVAKTRLTVYSMPSLAAGIAAGFVILWALVHLRVKFVKNINTMKLKRMILSSLVLVFTFLSTFYVRGVLAVFNCKVVLVDGVKSRFLVLDPSIECIDSNARYGELLAQAYTGGAFYIVMFGGFVFGLMTNPSHRYFDFIG